MVFESNKLMKESLDMSKEAAKAVKSFDTDGGESFEQGIMVDTEMKPSWLDSIKDSLSNIMNFTKPDDKSDEATKKKEALKAKKIAEREARWQEKTRKWRSDLKDSLVKGATDNPIVNFLKDHWKLLLVGLALFFLKPEQMKKAWDSLVKGMKWLIKEGPGILQGIWDTLDKWVPKVFDGIVTVSGWIKSLIDAVIGRKVTDEDVKEAEDRRTELQKKDPKDLSKKEAAELSDLNEKLAEDSQFRKDNAGWNASGGANGGEGKRQGGLLGESDGILGFIGDKLMGLGAVAILSAGLLALFTKSFVPIQYLLRLSLIHI